MLFFKYCHLKIVLYDVNNCVFIVHFPAWKLRENKLANETGFSLNHFLLRFARMQIELIKILPQDWSELESCIKQEKRNEKV